MLKKVSVKTDKSIQSILQLVAVIYLLIWSVSPPLQIDMIYRLLALGLAVIWFFIEFFRHFEFTKMQIFCAIFMVGVAFITYIKDGASSVIGQIAIYMMVLAYFINLYSTDEWENYKIAVPIIIALLIYFNYQTASALAQDATLARRLVRTDETTLTYLRQGVGGYGLIYPEVCISPVIYAWTLKSFEGHKLYFCLGVAWIVSFWAVIMNAGYSIAIFAALISFIILLFYRGQSFVPVVIISAAIIVVIVLMLVYVEGFRNLILNIFEGTKVVRKIEDLMSTATTDETADSFATRIDRYWMSIKTALQFPVIGGKIFDGNVGGHSEILDSFGKYGLWGGIPTLVMIFHTPNFYKKHFGYSSTILATANAHATALALVTFFDPLTYQAYCPILILCPIMYNDIMRWSGDKYEDTVDG